ncbi:MAG: hypothetical protein RJB66_809 [Pseudomonadota bacterium]
MLKNEKMVVTVVGGGLAGSECALQLANSGISVVLYEMRDEVITPAHRTSNFAEIVCSNSFGSMAEISAPGQLKWEAQRLNSFVLKAAHLAQVPAGQALGIDREVFAKTITKWIEDHPLIEVRRSPIHSLGEVPRPCVIATGPLTHESLARSLQDHFGGEFLYFFDAIAPIIDADSIDTSIAWKADRYDKGSPDYYNCPLNKEEYFAFISAIKAARKIEPKHFEETPFFESCMPIEVMVDRGDQTLRFGPMKPVGLTDPRTGRYPFAAVQLRQDNKEGTAYNIVGFQTRMAYGDQKEVFRMIPGLQNAEFLKLGSIHRNLFINTPKLLNLNLSSKWDADLFFAGQITGVEGYFESTSIGLLIAKSLVAKIKGLAWELPPRESAFGSLINAITDETKIKHFQPTNINMGLFPPLEEKIADKSIRKSTQIKKAQAAFATWASQYI